jgi:hypothetical protein
MNGEPIEEVYFNWLYSKVAFVMNPTPSLTFYSLLREIHSTEFVWFISGDDNRAQDGLDIRAEFLRESFLPHDALWLNLGCSVLEMLIAFSRRAEFQTDLGASEWFWIFLKNLNLDTFSDAKPGIQRKVSAVMERFVWRTYQRNGSGGMFPLKHPREDQRQVEIWYQFYEYLDENEIV